MNKHSISNASSLFVLFATTACVPDVSSIDDAGLLDTDTEGATDGADDAVPGEDGDGDGATSGADEGGGTSGGGEGGETGGSDGGEGGSDGGDTGGSDGGTDPVCGDGIVDDGEECDDGGESETCDSDCTAAACGDGVVNEAAGEACDGAGRTDACNDDCTLATCGDGVLNETAGEECDAGGESAECDADCTAASCGDGVTNASAGEACDDMGESAACNADCTAATCGDGVPNAAAGEGCDDGNDIDYDACTNACEVNEVDTLLLCGSSARDVSTFVPDGLTLNVVESCTPVSNTQAILVTRSGLTGLNENLAAIESYINGGGNLLTEYNVSDEVFNAIFGENVAQGGGGGTCSDRAPTVHQYSPSDGFWAKVPWRGISAGEAGCGRDMAGWPSITPLAGWSASTVAIAYRDHGAGRVWLTDFDWQDQDTQGAAYDYTEDLMGQMIMHSADCGGAVLNPGNGIAGCWYTSSSVGMSCTQVCADRGGVDAAASQHTGNTIGFHFWPDKADGSDWVTIECSSTDNNTNWGANGNAPDPAFSHPACYVNCACSE